MEEDPKRRCPLCGEDNRCAVAASADSSAACWCRDRSFSDAVLATVPVEIKSGVCLCQRHADPT